MHSQIIINLNSSTKTSKTLKRMSKPESIKIQPWSDFARYSDGIFTDDFVHTTLFACKLAAKGSRSTVNIKESISSKAGAYSMTDDVKFWFNLPQAGHSLYARVKSSNYVKLHYDCGIKQFKNRNWNFYGSLVCNKSLQGLVFKLGACHVHPKCNSDNRLRVQSTGSDYNYFWYHRTVVTHNKFTFGLLGVYDISRRVCQKNNLLIKYAHDSNTDLIFKANTDGFRKASPNAADWSTYFDVFNLDLIRKINDTTRIGVQVAVNARGERLRNAELIVQKKVPQRNLTVKAKINHKLDFAISSKIPMWGLEDIATVTKGFAVSNVASKDRRISYGWQLDLNV